MDDPVRDAKLALLEKIKEMAESAEDAEDVRMLSEAYRLLN